MEFASPNKHNVKLGDLLVSDFFDKPVLLEITDIYDGGVTAKGFFQRDYFYADAVILTQKGRYLIGENVRNSTDSDLSGDRLVTNNVNKQVLLYIETYMEINCDKMIFARGKDISRCFSLNETVILREDGSYEIGEEVRKRGDSIFPGKIF